ncbi:hypothetical protein [Dehalococcoides mccartyi]|uniref:MarR family transcriptional regulator n=1 Tax=Dehalococcoides mccartyi TaxID=61435 RepID=A0AB38Z885_9CHLR|nr:hypothetical protein [Dehalococcoides mccartyi]WRO06793.1 hypothetical protein VLL09_05240 [Dehalococcoides mccartyi]BEL01435.1 hypothetical protein DMOBY_12880 [Dehalococcoides mccartyi]
MGNERDMDLNNIKQQEDRINTYGEEYVNLSLMSIITLIGIIAMRNFKLTMGEYSENLTPNESNLLMEVYFREEIGIIDACRSTGLSTENVLHLFSNIYNKGYLKKVKKGKKTYYSIADNPPGDWQDVLEGYQKATDACNYFCKDLSDEKKQEIWDMLLDIKHNVNDYHVRMSGISFL